MRTLRPWVGAEGQVTGTDGVPEVQESLLEQAQEERRSKDQTWKVTKVWQQNAKLTVIFLTIVCQIGTDHKISHVKSFFLTRSRHSLTLSPSAPQLQRGLYGQCEKHSSWSWFHWRISDHSRQARGYAKLQLSAQSRSRSDTYSIPPDHNFLHSCQAGCDDITRHRTPGVRRTPKMFYRLNWGANASRRYQIDTRVNKRILRKLQDRIQTVREGDLLGCSPATASEWF